MQGNRHKVATSVKKIQVRKRIHAVTVRQKQKQEEGGGRAARAAAAVARFENSAICSDTNRCLVRSPGTTRSEAGSWRTASY